MLNIIRGINESKTLTKPKYISCECKCKFDGRKYHLDQGWNNDKWRCECKKRHVGKKDYVWNPATCSCQKQQYLAGVMGNSAITCVEIIESSNEDVKAKSYDETKTILINFSEKKSTCKTQNFYILLAFLLIIIALLIAVRIYCYLIKHLAKQKHLLSLQFTNNKLR